MSAANLDIIIYKRANLNLSLTYRDGDYNPIDVSNYGATFVAADKTKKQLFKATNVEGNITIGGAEGSIILNIDYEKYNNLTEEEGLYQLYIYPTSGDITDRPILLLVGNFELIESLL